MFPKLNRLNCTTIWILFSAINIHCIFVNQFNVCILLVCLHTRTRIIKVERETTVSAPKTATWSQRLSLTNWARVFVEQTASLSPSMLSSLLPAEVRRSWFGSHTVCRVLLVLIACSKTVTRLPGWNKSDVKQTKQSLPGWNKIAKVTFAPSHSSSLSFVRFRPLSICNEEFYWKKNTKSGQFWKLTSVTISASLLPIVRRKLWFFNGRAHSWSKKSEKSQDKIWSSSS